MIKTLIIGVGNSFRQDDRAGLAVVQQLATLAWPDTDYSEQSGEGTKLMASWQGYQQVYLIDAVSSDAPPGTIFRLNAQSQTVPAAFFNYSTHAFGVAEAIEMARVLGDLPPLLRVYGIEGADFGAGQELSPPVLQAVTQVIAEIVVAHQNNTFNQEGHIYA